LPGRVIQAGPADYLSKLAALQPGDTLLLAPGRYGVDANGADTSSVPGLPVFNLNGTASAPIIITGPSSGDRPVLLGRSTHNTVRVAGSSHVVIRNLDIDGRDLGGFGVAAQGSTHHITLENLNIRGVGGSQQRVGIAANAPTWNWIVRGNTIVGAGTGMYFGNSDGRNPFVAGLIERNVVLDTIGYNIQVKHQVPWSGVPADMPGGATQTIIRHNVFSKTSSFVSADGARPNLLVGDQPASGPGADNGFEIYGNFFYRNPTEALFQGEGKVAFYANVLYNPDGTAMRIQPHNGRVRRVRIFGNTIVALSTGIAVSGGLAGTTQRVTGNAVFAAQPLSVSGADALSAANRTGTLAQAADHLDAPAAALGSLDLHPKAGALASTGLDAADLSAYPDWNLDFNGRARSDNTAGAYDTTGVNPGWTLQRARKP
jgi:hypothetical protein